MIVHNVPIQIFWETHNVHMWHTKRTQYLAQVMYNDLQDIYLHDFVVSEFLIDFTALDSCCAIEKPGVSRTLFNLYLSIIWLQWTKDIVKDFAFNIEQTLLTCCLAQWEGEEKREGRKKEERERES